MSKGIFIGEQATRGILLSTLDLHAIMERFGVSSSTVHVVKRLKTKKAKKIAAQLESEGLSPVIWESGPKKHNFTSEQIAYIRTSPKNSFEVAAEAGCSPSLIRMIRSGKAYPE